jgi:hypothetical protein
LSFFFAEAVSDVVMATFAPVHIMAGTTELTAPALQRGEPDAFEAIQLMDTGVSAIPSPRICRASSGRQAPSSVPVLFPEGLNLF